MRFALLLPRMDDGGAEHVMLQLGRGLAGRGHAVDLVVATRGGPLDGRIPPELNAIHLDARRTATALPALVAYLGRARPAALLATLEHGNLLALGAGALVRPRPRVVLREANVALPARELHGAKERLLRALARRFYPAAGVVVAVSHAVARSLTEELRLPAARVRTIYNPVLTPEIARLAAEPLDDPWFTAGAVPVVLGVGRLAPQKDFPTLLRAFAMARAERPGRPLRLVILGEGPDRALLESLAHALGIGADVRFPGFDPNPFRYMRRATVFALSSIFEGLPGALVQAMACGCRVVATDAPGGSSEVLGGHPPGRLVPPRDAAAMATAICDLLADADRDPQRPTYPLDRFTEQAAIDQYLAVLSGGSG